MTVEWIIKTVLLATNIQTVYSLRYVMCCWRALHFFMLFCFKYTHCMNNKISHTHTKKKSHFKKTVWEFVTSPSRTLPDHKSCFVIITTHEHFKFSSVNKCKSLCLEHDFMRFLRSRLWFIRNKYCVGKTIVHSHAPFIVFTCICLYENLPGLYLCVHGFYKKYLPSLSVL